MGNNDVDIARYIPLVLKLVFQGMLEDIDTKEKSCKYILQKHGRVRFSDTTT